MDDQAIVSADCRKEPKTPATTAGDEAARPAPTETSATTGANSNASANSSTAAGTKTPGKVEPTNKRTDLPDPVASNANKGRGKKPKPKPNKHRRTASRVVTAAVPAEAESEASDDADATDSDSDSDSETDADDSGDDSDSDIDSSSDSSSEEGEAKRNNKNKKKKKKKLKLQKKLAAAKLKKIKKNKKKKKAKKAKLASDSDSSSSSDQDIEADDLTPDDSSADASSKNIGGQLQALRLQFSALQQQLSSANGQLGNGGLGLNAVGNSGLLGNGLNVGGLPGSGLSGGYGGMPGSGLSGLSGLSSGLNAGNTLDQSTPLNPRRMPNRGRAVLARNKLLGLGLGQLDQEPGGSSDTKSQSGKKKKRGKGMRSDFKRVDWVWDTSNYMYKLQDTAETNTDAQYNDYIFHVRRTFDCEGKYRATFVDIKSKLLRECLQDVIGNVRGVSLVDETPKMDPNMLFLYLEEFRTHLKHLKQVKPAGDKKRERKKNQKRLDDKRKQLKVLIKYLDKDYAKIKDSLYPMLQNGLITFDLLWALWKPNTLAYTTTYGSSDEPRVFQAELAERQSTIMKGDYYYIDGKYFEFDGKRFGYGGLSEEVAEFQGARKITSLHCYPLKYHKDEEGVRAQLIERGKKFVALSGVNYRSYSGMAYLKRKKGVVVKFNIQHSRIMVDPAIFRRINPNYYVSVVRPKDHDIISDGGLSDEESDCCACESGDGGDDEEEVKFVTKIFKNAKGEICMASLPKDDGDEDEPQESLGALPTKALSKDAAAEEGDGTKEDLELTDEEYLIASPVVLGFAFSEKQWLEFSVSGVKDIKWNEDAWDSLVLEPSTKDLIQALVKSRKYSAAQTIDDVIQGKGKGLVTVLHGPPGTGKTLTAEGISELLKCPLYMASAGELGTDSRYLEKELQKILDICHAWGAILLLDEADVFLEKRNMHDIHRNALVSIFLRQLEYFQGILFLTTNRVETFDEAFQSRIHIALRYDNLDAKAKKTIFKMFIERVRSLGQMKLEEFTDEELTGLAKHELNGREIKNVVGSAQDLAVNKGEALSMRHIRQVLDVHAKFGRDLRGGTGYEEAMRSYF